VARNLEHASSNSRENLLHDFDDAMVESVHGAARARLAYATHYQRLDFRRLDFDVHSRPVTDGIENRFECRNPGAMRQREAADL